MSQKFLSFFAVILLLTYAVLSHSAKENEASSSNPTAAIHSSYPLHKYFENMKLTDEQKKLLKNSDPSSFPLSSKGECTWGFNTSTNLVPLSQILDSKNWTTVGSEKLLRASTIGHQHLSYTCGLNSAAKVFRMYDKEVNCDTLVKEYDPYLSVHLLNIKVGAKPKDLCTFINTKVGDVAQCQHTTFKEDFDMKLNGVENINKALDAGFPTIIVMYCDWVTMHYVSIVGYNDYEFLVWNTNGNIHRVPIDTVVYWMKIGNIWFNLFTGLENYEFLTIYGK